MTFSRCKILLFFNITLASGCFAREYNCPSTIEEEPHIAFEGKLWSVHSKLARRSFDQASISFGKDGQLGSLVPDDTYKNKSKEVLKWMIQPPDSEFGWVVCSYNQTSAKLVQKLDKSLKQCEISYNLTPKGKPTLDSILCN